MARTGLRKGSSFVLRYNPETALEETLRLQQQERTADSRGKTIAAKGTLNPLLRSCLVKDSSLVVVFLVRASRGYSLHRSAQSGYDLASSRLARGRTGKEDIKKKKTSGAGGVLERGHSNNFVGGHK